MYEDPLNNKQIKEFCKKIRFDERNSVLSEIIDYELENKTLSEIIELLEETLVKQEPYMNGLFRKTARYLISYYKKGYEDGMELTKDDGVLCGELSYKKSMENR